jgi:hypothetical protein
MTNVKKGLLTRDAFYCTTSERGFKSKVSRRLATGFRVLSFEF